MKTKTPPEFFGITLDKTLDSVTGRFLKTGDYNINSYDDADAVREIIRFIRCCSIAIEESLLEIVKAEKPDETEIAGLVLKAGGAISELAGFTNELLLITPMSNDDKRDRLDALLEDINCFDDTYIAELRNY